ncbi:MAG TPA: GNAT family N-acetyltransferase [Gemmataceae bacterium]|nr:GNAT family N-acetyltransferase [Gemmataceae bacterium]
MIYVTQTLREQALVQAAARSERSLANTSSLNIRTATREDFPEMLAIFRKVLAAGDTYVLDADTPVSEAYAYWFGAGIDSWVAEANGRVVGMCRLTANQKGRGSHVASASIMVDPNVRRRAVGLALGRHLRVEARKAGFLAMQFNMVVSSNTASLALAEKLGFTIVGTLPRAFEHPQVGLVDAYVMHRLV